MGQFAHLSPLEVDILQGLSQAGRHYPARTELRQDGRCQTPLLVLSGWACDQRILSDGRRQILRFILPGDPVGSLANPALPASSATVALTQVVVTDARPLLPPTDPDGARHAGFAEAIAQSSHAAEINGHDHVVRLGRQTAYQRMVHLFLEFHDRLQAIGLVAGTAFPLPLTQEMLADALGLSFVHVNRTLQQVRRDKLLDMRGGRMVLHELEQMRSVAA